MIPKGTNHTETLSGQILLLRLYTFYAVLCDSKQYITPNQ
jgi:hypothetical protein